MLMPDPTPSRYAAILASNLSIARTAVSMTQYELAQRAQVSRATIAQIEASRGDPRLSTISALAGALGVTPSTLTTCPRSAARTLDLIDYCHEVIDDAPDDTKSQTLKRLARSPLRKERHRSAKLAVEFITSIGYDHHGSHVGGAIYNAHVPGIGATIGAFIHRHAGEEEALKNIAE